MRRRITIEPRPTPGNARRFWILVNGRDALLAEWLPAIGTFQPTVRAEGFDLDSDELKHARELARAHFAGVD